jgi:hypothetical protein
MGYQAIYVLHGRRRRWRKARPPKLSTEAEPVDGSLTHLRRRIGAKLDEGGEELGQIALPVLPQVFQQFIKHANANAPHVGLVRLHQLPKSLNVPLKDASDGLWVSLGDGRQGAAYLLEELIIPVE